MMLRQKIAKDIKEVQKNYGVFLGDINKVYIWNLLAYIFYSTLLYITRRINDPIWRYFPDEVMIVAEDANTNVTGWTREK